MTETRQQIADVLLTAAVVGVGLVTGNPVIATVVGGIGINWASELTRGGWQAACQRLLGSSGLLNHDLQQALARAFRQALAHLEQAWWETPHARHMRRAQPDIARETSEVFKMLREDASAFCCADGLGRAAGNKQVQQLLYGDETTARRALAGCLSDYLHGHDPNLIAFLDAHLVQALAFWFGEELKADRPESNRAWRAFQRLLLEGLQTSLTEVQAGQRDTQRILENLRGDLQAWADQMDARSADVRERTGEAALLQALTGMRDELLAAIATEAGLTRTAIEAAVERIVLLFSEDLARLRGDLLPLLGKRGLVEGQAPLRADLRRHFDALLQDYALFGGRAEELAAIHTFLADPRGGYLFITGPSGYGKTALLAQLALQGETAYHFFSRAYDTAGEDLFLRNLCQQLAARHDLGGQLPTSTAELRALCPDLLRLPPADGRPVVVLIDGLDEAANWEPGPLHFPADVPDGVKVIFSARQVADQDWLTRLRLPRDRIQQLALGAMTAEDVRSLLLAAGESAAPLADEPGWIAQALRVSAGDPFYVKLLVEDVRDGRMLPEQIDAQPEGLDAYLKGWWKQIEAAVRAQDVRDLMGALAVARGPIGRDDLIAVFPELGWALDGVLTEVRRFVIGDERQGYALCHPRFADYVRRRVGPRSLETYTDTLLTYCAGWREHRSPYALAHYAGHLAEAGRWEELHTLVATGDERQEWAEARFAVEGSYAGYLADLGLAWAHADKQGLMDPAAVGRQVRYALIESSVHSLAGNIPPGLLAALVKHNIRGWTPAAALNWASQMPGDIHHGGEPLGHSRSEAIAAIAPFLQTGLRRSVLEREIASVRDAEPWVQGNTVSALAPHLPQDLLDKALHMAKQIQSIDALIALLPYLDLQRRDTVVGEALIAAKNPNRLSYPDELAILAAYLPLDSKQNAQAEVLAVMKAKAKDAFSEWRARKTLAALVPHLPSVLLPDAIDLARDMGWNCAEAIAGLAPRLHADLLTEASCAARSIVDAHDRVEVLAALLPHLPVDLHCQILEEALVSARLLRSELERAHALTMLLPNAPSDLKNHLLTEVLTLIRATPFVANRTRALDELTPHLPTDLLPEALDTVHRIGDDQELIVALTALARGLCPEAIPDLFESVIALRGDLQRARALGNIASYLPKSLLERAWLAASALPMYDFGRCPRAEALISLAPYMGTPLALEQAVTAAFAGIEQTNETNSVLIRLAPLMPYLSPESVESALMEALRIRDIPMLAAALLALAPRITFESPPKVLEDAQATDAQDSILSVRVNRLTALVEIRSLDERNLVLAVLSPFLPADLQDPVLPYLRQDMLIKAVQIACAIEDVDDLDRPDALFALASFWSDLATSDRPTAYHAWTNSLHVLSARARHQFLGDLAVLAPVASALDGSIAMNEAAQAASDVDRWWP